MPREAGITVRELKTVLSNSDILGDGADSSLTFEFEREGNYENYHLEGDKKFDEADLLALRESLFSNQRLQQQLEAFWRLSTFRDDDASPGTISKKQYVDVHIKLSKALRADWELGKAGTIADEDWRSDLAHYFQTVPLPAPVNDAPRVRPRGHQRKHSLSSGEEVMDKACFLWSIFEIADHWTDTVSADHYVHFLRKLFRRITALDDSVIWQYKPDVTTRAKGLLRHPNGAKKHEQWSDGDTDNDEAWNTFNAKECFDLEEASFSGSERASFQLKSATEPLAAGKERPTQDEYITANLASLTAKTIVIARDQENFDRPSLWLRSVQKIAGGNTGRTHRLLRLRRKSLKEGEMGLRYKRLHEIKPFWQDDPATDDDLHAPWDDKAELQHSGMGQHRRHGINADAGTPDETGDIKHSRASTLPGNGASCLEGIFSHGENRVADGIVSPSRHSNESATNNNHVALSARPTDGAAVATAHREGNSEVTVASAQRPGSRRQHLAERGPKQDLSATFPSYFNHGAGEGENSFAPHANKTRGSSSLSVTDQSSKRDASAQCTTGLSNGSRNESWTQQPTNSSSDERVRKRRLRLPVFLNDREAGVNAMESAAARRALRRAMERRINTSANSSSQAGEFAASIVSPAGNADVLPSLVSFDFASSLKLGLEKEDQRRQKDLRHTAIAASSAGITPTNAAVFGPALPLDVAGCEEVSQAKETMLPPRRTTLRRGRLIEARVGDEGSALEVSVAVARRRRLRPLSPGSPTAEIRQHLRRARPARPIAVSSLPSKVVAHAGIVDRPSTSIILEKTGPLPTDFLSQKRATNATRKQRPLRNARAVMQSRWRGGFDDRIYPKRGGAHDSSASTGVSKRRMWNSQNAQRVRRPSTTFASTRW